MSVVCQIGRRHTSKTTLYLLSLLARRTYRPTTSTQQMTGQLNTWLNDGRVVAVGLFILWLCAPQSAPQDVVVTVESSKCYGKSDCSLHLMNCSARHRMAIKEAAYYFQTTARFTQCGGAVNAVPPYCMDDCCRNNGSDCSQSMTPDNLELVRSSCSYQTTCSTRAQWAGKVDCGSGFAVSSTYDVLRADCISDDVIVDPCTDVTVNGNLLSIIYGYNTVVNPNCTCRLDATSGNDTNNNQNIIVSAYDINASYDSVWSMTITKAGMEHPPILYQLQGFQNYFPAAVLLRGPSPLTLTFFSPSQNSRPQRGWLGLQADTGTTEITLRCGQDVTDYERYLAYLAITTTTTTSTTTSTTTTPPPTTTATTPPPTTTTPMTTTTTSTTTTTTPMTTTTTSTTTTTITTTTTTPTTSMSSTSSTPATTTTIPITTSTTPTTTITTTTTTPTTSVSSTSTTPAPTTATPTITITTPIKSVSTTETSTTSISTTLTTATTKVTTLATTTEALTSVTPSTTSTTVPVPTTNAFVVTSSRSSVNSTTPAPHIADTTAAPGTAAQKFADEASEGLPVGAIVGIVVAAVVLSVVVVSLALRFRRNCYDEVNVKLLPDQSSIRDLNWRQQRSEQRSLKMYSPGSGRNSAGDGWHSQPQEMEVVITPTHADSATSCNKGDNSMGPHTDSAMKNSKGDYNPTPDAVDHETGNKGDNTKGVGDIAGPKVAAVPNGHAPFVSHVTVGSDRSQVRNSPPGDAIDETSGGRHNGPQHSHPGNKHEAEVDTTNIYSNIDDCSEAKDNRQNADTAIYSNIDDTQEDLDTTVTRL